MQRGLAFRNLFLTGDENGVPQTFLRTQDFLRDTLAVLYSPIGLHFRISPPGQTSPVERAKCSTAASELRRRIIDDDVDDQISEQVLWSLIKGKTIQQMVWSRNGLEPYLIQPESFAVYNESINTLARQEAFVHSTFPTRSRFVQLISVLPQRRQEEIMRKVDSVQIKEKDREDVNSTLKQIIVGGLYPYQTAAMVPATGGGTVTHLFAPQPSMQSQVIAEMVPVDELWVWNDEMDDWATITQVGDEIIFGGDQLYNAFAHDKFTDPSLRDEHNPLRGKHGFVEYCPMPLDGYFWGISYVYLVTLLQKSINKRIDGINIMLRKEEDPPRFLSGSTSINQNAYAKLNKPGGYWTDGSPTAKMQDLAKEVPTDIWKSFHELNGMFDIIGGFPPIMRGEGEGSVRSQGQSDVLLRMGSGRHLDAALKIERAIERTGSIIYDILRAKDNTALTAWVMPGTKTVQQDVAPDPTLEPPAEGMIPVTFQFKHLDKNAKVTVDSHSASPAFRHEVRDLAVTLAKIGAASPSRVVELTHPPQEEEMVEDIERKEIAQAKLFAEHPELLEHQGKKKK